MAVISFTAMRRDAEGKNIRCVSRILVKETKISIRDKRGEGGGEGAGYERGLTRPILHAPSFSPIPFRSNNGSFDRACRIRGIANECEKIDRRRFEPL